MCGPSQRKSAGGASLVVRRASCDVREMHRAVCFVGAWALVALGCGGTPEPPREARQVEVASATPLVVEPSPSARTEQASAPSALPMSPKPSTCLAPWSGAMDDPKLAPRAIDPKRQAEIASLGVDPVELAYAQGRVFFESNHWVEAAQAFRDIAFRQMDHDVGVYAALLYLESMNVLAVHGKRPECNDDLRRDAVALSGIYCTARRKRNEEPCSNLDTALASLDKRR